MPQAHMSRFLTIWQRWIDAEPAWVTQLRDFSHMIRLGGKYLLDVVLYLLQNIILRFLSGVILLQTFFFKNLT